MAGVILACHDDRRRVGPALGCRARNAGAVGRDEVDQRGWVLQELAELVPAVVGLQDMVAGLAEELVAHHVERRHAFRAATRYVERGEVERQAEQVVAQRAGDELVNLVADLGDRAERQLTGGVLAGHRGRRADW